MNLPWIVFRVSTSGAVGDIGANALRLCTIILAIGLTVAYKRKQGLPYPNTDQYINYQQDTKCVKSTSPYS